MDTQKLLSDVITKLKSLWADRRSYKKRLIIAAPAVFAACFMFIFFGPFEMVAFGGNSLSYGYKDVFWLLAGAAILAFAALSALIACLRGKIFNYVTCSVFALTVCGYLQAAFMNGDLGALTGDGIDWEDKARVMTLGLIVWLVIFLVAFLIMYLNRMIWAKTVLVVSALLVVMQLAPTVGIIAGGYGAAKTKSISEYSLTDEGMYQYSKGDNIFVFVLDRLDYGYIERVMEKDPDFFERLDGFTSYTNTISAYARTQPALSHLLSGSDKLAYTVGADEYYEKTWSQDGKGVLPALDDKGYDVSIYSNIKYLFADPAYATEYVDNVTDGKGAMKPVAMLKKLINLSAYRYSPIVAKPFFWADTNYYNKGVFKKLELTPYQFDDAGYAPGFKSATADGDKASFKLYHFYGPHSPYTMNADGTASDTTTTVVDQTMGSFNNLFAAFDKMKELGIYEDATIIITADHGAAVSDYKQLQKATRIGLFYKPSGSAGTPLVQSSAPVCTSNITATIVKASGADYSAYGKSVDEVVENEAVERFYYKTALDKKTGDEGTLYTYSVTGDAADFNNWKLVSTTAIQSGYNFY